MYLIRRTVETESPLSSSLMKSIDIGSGEFASLLLPNRDDVVFHNRPVTDFRAFNHLVSKDIVMPMIQQLRHRHLRVRRW